MTIQKLFLVVRNKCRLTVVARAAVAEVARPLMGVGGYSILFARCSALLALPLWLACADRPPAGPKSEAQPEWLSEPDYEIGDAVRGDAAFGMVGQVRAGPDGERVFVLEPNRARASVWTPDGTLLLDLGRAGEGPGDFMLPYRVHAWESGFYVRDQVRFTFFAYNGTLLRTVPNPPTLVSYQGFPINVGAILDDGSFLGDPGIPATYELGLWGDDPIDREPVLRVWESDAGWSQETVAWINKRNGGLGITLNDGFYIVGQPFAAADQYRLDRGAGTVMLARLSRDYLEPGEAEFLEISAGGDTIWRRRVSFDPLRLTRPMLDEAIDGHAETLDRTESPEEFRGHSPRKLVEDALYAPEYLPALDYFLLASTGRHIWLKSLERVDTLRVWYAIERNDRESPPRRVLLPESVIFWDMTDTHVWGVRRDELDINYVVGRRLVPPS